MSYEPSGILTEGRTFDFRQEAGGWTIEPRKGKTGPKPKPKDAQACVECGRGIHKAAARDFKPKQLYCSPECNYTAKRRITDERAKCLACHALVGMTATASGKMVNVQSSVISGERKKRGIKGITYEQASAVSHMKRMNHPDYIPPAYADTSAMEYTRACMKSIRQARIGFDWSYLWSVEKAKKASLKKWHSMTPEQKLIRGRAQRDTPEKRWKKQDRLTQWKKDRRKSDPIFKLIESFRSRLCAIIPSKDERTKELIGCTPEQLRQHLESKFTKQMNWLNHGSYWHVDHILPCASFDHTIKSQRQQCWHWTNLQPLEARKNILKRDKITHPQMSLLLCSTL